MTDHWQKLGDITARILEPVFFEVRIDGPLAAALRKEAKRLGNKEETIIAEAVRAYMGEEA